MEDEKKLGITEKSVEDGDQLYGSRAVVDSAKYYYRILLHLFKAHKHFLQTSP